MGNIQGMSLEAIFQILKWKVQVAQKKYINDQPKRAMFYALLILWAFYTYLKHKGLLKKKSLSGQHAFITGGGMGIGRRMALILAAQNVKITIADLNMEAAQKVVEEILKLKKQKAIAVQCDVSNVESVNNAAKEAEEQNGPVDILINNAGIVTGKNLLESTEKGIDKVYAVNAVSHAYTTRAFLPGMIQRNKGHVVSIASIAGHLGVAGLVDYCGSKFAAVGFDESLRMELQKRNSKVQTTCICPYFINTGMFDGIHQSLLQKIFVPILEEKYASERIITGIRQNEKMVIMPYFLYLVVFLKSFLPIGVFDKIVHLVGINRNMDSFKGRQQK